MTRAAFPLVLWNFVLIGSLVTSEMTLGEGSELF
jgi:hypothetical protein